MYCWLAPVVRLAPAGVTLMEATTAGVTVTDGVVAVLLCQAAVIVADPVPAPVARPFVSTVITAELEVLQVTVEEMFWVLLSLKWPVAVNCSVVPFAKLGGLAGVMVMELRVALVAAAVKVFVTPSTEKVTVLLPGATAVMSPLLLTLTDAALEELKTALLVRFCVDPSENVPVTVSCVLVPWARTGLDGLKAMETRVAEVTRKLAVDAVVLPKAALIWADPAAMPVARPLASTEATLALEVDQVTWVERFWVVASENVPVAVNC